MEDAVLNQDCEHILTSLIKKRLCARSVVEVIRLVSRLGVRHFLLSHLPLSWFGYCQLSAIALQKSTTLDFIDLQDFVSLSNLD